MSSSDNAKNKLLDSMRMSKSGAPGTAADKPASENTAKAADKPAASKPAAKKKAATKKKPAAAKKPASKNKAAAQDPFQAARRIWPD